MYKIGEVTGGKDFAVHPFMVKYDPVLNHHVYDGGFCRPAPLVRLPVPPDYDKIYLSPWFYTCYQFGSKCIQGIGETIVSHPFVILRRQCQVASFNSTYHLAPHALIPFIYHLQRQQGLSVLWKGLGSTILMQLLQCNIEDFITNCKSWPQKVDTRFGCFEKVKQHLFLKTVSWLCITPFYAAALIETVRSQLTNEHPRILDVYRYAFRRMFEEENPPTRIFLRYLILPTVIYGFLKCFFKLMIKQTIERLIPLLPQTPLFYSLTRYPPPYQNSLSHDLLLQNRKLFASMSAAFITDVFLYPYETVLHRCLIQGTGTIVDNLDNTRYFHAVLTYYTNLKDCSDDLLQGGELNFYRGFGALILEYVTYISFVYFGRKLFLRALLIYYREFNPQRPIEADVYRPFRKACNQLHV